MKRSHLTLVMLSALAALDAGSSAAPAATHSGTRAATIKVAASRLGRIIVDGRGRTLYVFEKDTRGHSACAGACPTYLPPLLTHGKPIAIEKDGR